MPAAVSEERGVEGQDPGGGASVVLRVRCVVSADGGGGSDRVVNREARQRKHSPLPK